MRVILPNDLKEMDLHCLLEYSPSHGMGGHGYNKLVQVKAESYFGNVRVQ